jgi:hypothetical protein
MTLKDLSLRPDARAWLNDAKYIPATPESFKAVPLKCMVACSLTD